MCPNLIVISHFILKKSHHITGSPRMIFLEYSRVMIVFRSNALAKMPFFNQILQSS